LASDVRGRSVVAGNRSQPPRLNFCGLGFSGLARAVVAAIQCRPAERAFEDDNWMKIGRGELRRPLKIIMSKICIFRRL
jgi:hypothetical protein